jgi:CBS domain-containing membrane protein
MHVRDLMERDVATLHVTDTLDLADDIMRLGRIRHLPVVDANARLVGVLSQRDLFRAALSSVLQADPRTEREWLAQVSVRAAMTPFVFTVGPDTSVRTAIGLMLERKIGCVPVVDDDRLVGLLSESDCLRYLAHVLDLSIS